MSGDLLRLMMLRAISSRTWVRGSDRGEFLFRSAMPAVVDGLGDGHFEAARAGSRWNPAL